MFRTMTKLVLALVCSLTALALAGALMPGRPAGTTRVPLRSETASAPIAAADPGWRVMLPLVSRSYLDFRSPLANVFGVEVPGGLVGSSARTALVHGLSTTWIRRNRISRSAIEQSPGVYTFPSSLDADLAALGAAGLTPIVIVADDPAWTGSNGGPLSDDQLPALANFMRALVSRYQGPPYNVKYWELYNEPDNLDETAGALQGGRWGGAGAQYARMLQAVYPAVKEADPNAKIVFGGLALDFFRMGNATFTADGGGNFDPNFLEDVLNAGAGPWFDVMNFHYYPEYDWRWNTIGRANGTGLGIAAKAGYIRSRLDAHGVRSKPLICTEIGVSSDPNRPAEPPTDVDATVPKTDPRFWTPSSAEEQSRFVVRTLARGLSQGLSTMVWYPLADAGASGAIASKVDFFAYHGLVDYQMNQKPVYGVYRFAIQQLAGARFIRAATASDLGTTSAEGYLFQMPNGQQQWVIWSNQYQLGPNEAGLTVVKPLPTTVTLSTAAATVVEKDSTSRTVTSPNPAVQYITFQVGPSPTYVLPSQ